MAWLLSIPLNALATWLVTVTEPQLFMLMFITNCVITLAITVTWQTYRAVNDQRKAGRL